MKPELIFKKLPWFGLLVFCFTLLSAILLPCAQVKAADETDALKPELNVTSKSLVKESTYDLKVYNLDSKQKVYFKSSASSIASVDKTGTITANKIGTATITATIKEKYKTLSTLQCEITVGPPAVSVKLNKSNIALTIGKRTSVKAMLSPGNTVEEPTYISSNPAIATVTSTGTIIAKGIGKVTITAAIANENKDLCEVTITNEPEEIPMEPIKELPKENTNDLTTKR